MPYSQQNKIQKRAMSDTLFIYLLIYTQYINHKTVFVSKLENDYHFKQTIK